MTPTDSATLEPAASPRPEGDRVERRTYYRDHVDDLQQRVSAAVEREELRRMHVRSGWRHAAVALRQALLGAVCLWGTIVFHEPWIWIPLAALQGTVILSFIILLHEVVHETVSDERRPGLLPVLGLLYAAPSAISASQFTRWHLDHHDGLGSATEDPKRAHLSPKRNARWYKALYMTAALFPIYARASATEAKRYPAALRRTVNLERLANVVLHAG